MNSLDLLAPAQLAPATGAFSIVGFAVVIAITILAFAWLLLPLLILNELGKVRKQLRQSEEVISATLRQILPVVEQLQEQTDSQRRALEVLDSIAVHLYNLDGEVQHSNTLLEWIGTQRKPVPLANPSSAA